MRTPIETRHAEPDMAAVVLPGTNSGGGGRHRLVRRRPPRLGLRGDPRGPGAAGGRRALSVHRCRADHRTGPTGPRLPRHSDRGAGLPTRSPAPKRCCSSAPSVSGRWSTFRLPSGWQRLRQVLGQPATRDVARILGPVLAGPRRGPRRYPALLRGPDPDGARDLHRPPDLAERTPIRRTTLDVALRPGRATLAQELPGARCASCTRRCCFERPGYTVADVAYRLDYSARPRASGGTCAACLGITTSEFRRAASVSAARRACSVAVMVAPYAARPWARSGCARAGWLGVMPTAPARAATASERLRARNG